MMFSDDFPFAPKKWPFFYGYFIVLCSVIGVTLSAPGQTIGVLVFTDFLIEHLEINRFQISITYTVATIIGSVIINRTGKTIDRFGSRNVAFFSTILLGCILIYMSQVDRITGQIAGLLSRRFDLFIKMVTVTIGFLLMRYFGVWGLGISSRIMLMKWFIEKRGRMNSILGLFVTLTFAFIPFFSEKLIDRFSWRAAWILMSVLIGLIFSIFIAVFFRDVPERCGLIADGKKHKRSTMEEEKIEENWTLRQARRTFTFWVFNLTLSMFGLLSTALTFHVVSVFERAGLSRNEAITIFLPVSFFAVAINLAAGWLVDREPLKYRLKFLFAFQLFGLLLLSVGLIILHRGWGKYIVIAGYGISRGLLNTLLSVTWARYYGRKNLGAISSYNMSFVVFFGALGPILFGWSFDKTGNYNLAIFFCCMVQILLLILCTKADKPRLRQQNQ
jgi:MFS family permease